MSLPTALQTLLANSTVATRIGATCKATLLWCHLLCTCLPICRVGSCNGRMAKRYNFNLQQLVLSLSLPALAKQQQRQGDTLRALALSHASSRSRPCDSSMLTMAAKRVSSVSSGRATQLCKSTQTTISYPTCPCTAQCSSLPLPRLAYPPQT